MKRTPPIKVVLPNGTECMFVGREAWTLRNLVDAGSAGVTTIDRPAPRWSHYIFKLRKAGLTISTEYEAHGGTYPGTHGRYRLETPLQIIEGSAE
jgi:hypothetical protein